jgi:DNA uptake protein ComE-like DNA-binding protein
MEAGGVRDSLEQRDTGVIRTAFLLVVGMSLTLCLVWAILGRAAGQPGPAIVLEDTINPNTASVASLLRLPGVGPQRAQAIVDYRMQVEKQRGGPAFRDLRDVDAVPGLGPATVQGMAPFLRFREP